MRSTTEVFEDHLAKRLKGDVEGDIKANYARDVVLLTGTGVFKGHDGVRESAAESEKKDSVPYPRNTTCFRQLPDGSKKRS